MCQTIKIVQHLFFIFFFVFSFSVYSKDLNIKSFDDLWAAAQQSSHSLKSSHLEIKSLQVGLQRSKRYLLPTLQFSTSIYGTNNPAQSLFSSLSERSVLSSDFDPETLNHPEFQLFSQQSFYLDWNFYQGGFGKANVNVLEKTVEATKYKQQAQLNQEYAEFSAYYANLLSAEKQSSQIKSLLLQLNDLFRNYQLSSPQNPLGTSGALGLASLKNRLLGLEIQSSSEKKLSKIYLSKRAELENEKWSISSQNLLKFLDAHFNTSNTSTDHPPQIKALSSSAQAIEESVKAEKSKFLPKIGLYQEATFYEGNRNASAALNVGAYLKWNIFSPTEYGAVKQKQLEALAMNEKAKSKALDAEIERKQSINNIQSLKQNLKLTDDSVKLSEAQIKTSRDLYQNGVISILQLLEILNRRADLITQIHQMEAQLINENVKSYLNGGSHEN